jgi:hypothetical protein
VDSTPPTSEPQLPKLEQCQLDALRNKNSCLVKVSVAAGVQLSACAWAASGGPVAVTVCAAAVAALAEYNKGLCEEQHFEENAWCKIENPTQTP